jgi:hypothetical protein
MFLKYYRRFHPIIQESKRVIRKLVLATAACSLTVVVGLGFNPAKAWATAGQKVNCDKVMEEVHAGKKTKEIDKDLSISSSSVYKCKKKATASASKGTPPKGATSMTSAAANSPAAAASPAAK